MPDQSVMHCSEESATQYPVCLEETALLPSLAEINSAVPEKPVSASPEEAALTPPTEEFNPVSLHETVWNALS